MMNFFRKKQPEINPDLGAILDLSEATQDRIEIQLAKDASAEAQKKVQKINDHFNELIKENHFHVKIFIATGGKPKRKSK